jgi:hypothetical protein
MKLDYLQKPDFIWTEKLPKTKEYPRHYVTIVDLDIELSNGLILNIPKGEIWDGASIPKWLWWLMKPIDAGAIGDLIHDMLWVNQFEQIVYFNSIFDARKFADAERVRWRNHLAPNKKIKTAVTNFVIRKLGGLFYSRQLKIPN